MSPGLADSLPQSRQPIVLQCNQGDRENMKPTSAEPRQTTTGWRSPNVWATPESFEGNSVKQLLVPAGIFSYVHGVLDEL